MTLPLFDEPAAPPPAPEDATCVRWIVTAGEHKGRIGVVRDRIKGAHPRTMFFIRLLDPIEEVLVPSADVDLVMDSVCPPSPPPQRQPPRRTPPFPSSLPRDAEEARAAVVADRAAA